MKTKKEKIATVKELAGKKPEILTPFEREFIKKHTTPGGIVIRNPNVDEMKIIKTLDAKGVEATIIHRKIIDK
jgi:hypothetical protein